VALRVAGDLAGVDLVAEALAKGARAHPLAKKKKEEEKREKEKMETKQPVMERERERLSAL
jgi:hypothetical protein